MKRDIAILVCLSAALLCGSADRAHAWTMTRDFESGITDTHNTGVTWTTERAHGGTHAAKVTFTQGTEASDTTIDFTFPQTLVQGDEVWYRSYVYLQSPWSWNCSPVVKFMRIATNQGWNSILGSSGGYLVYSNEPSDVQYGIDTTFDLDRWQSIEMYVKLHSADGSAMMRYWKDGILVNEDTTATLPSASGNATWALWWSYWNGNVPQNQVAYMDDVTITTDMPANQDIAGNRMIGPTGWGSGDTTPPGAPSGLGVQ